MTSMRDTLLSWGMSEAALDSRAMSHVSRGRKEQVFARVRAAAEELIATEDRVATDPRLSAEGKKDDLKQARARVREKHIPTIKGIMNALGEEVKGLSTLPPPQGISNADIARAAEIRQEMSKLPEIEIWGRYQQAGASGDLETLRALDGANPAVFPKIATALDSVNPDTRREVALAVKYKDNPDARKVADDLVELETVLTSIVGDLEREVGVPAPIYDAVTGKPLDPGN